VQKGLLGDKMREVSFSTDYKDKWIIHKYYGLLVQIKPKTRP
jgi:hypothetical protein